MCKHQKQFNLQLTLVLVKEFELRFDDCGINTGNASLGQLSVICYYHPHDNTMLAVSISVVLTQLLSLLPLLVTAVLPLSPSPCSSLQVCPSATNELVVRLRLLFLYELHYK